MKSSLDSHWKDRCWSWSSKKLATWCEELTHWKSPWCWERLRAGGEGGDRVWDGWMASPFQWTWVLANSRRWKDREAWDAAVHGVAKSHTQLSDRTTTIALYTNNKRSEREIKETIPFTTTTKRVKYLGINLGKEAKDLYFKIANSDF